MLKHSLYASTPSYTVFNPYFLIFPHISPNFPYFRKFPEMYGISGNFRKYMKFPEISGNFRKCMKISGNFRKFMEIFFTLKNKKNDQAWKTFTCRRLTVDTVCFRRPDSTKSVNYWDFSIGIIFFCSRSFLKTLF